MIAGRYLTRLFLWRLAGVLLALAALMQMLDLLDNASSVLMRGGGIAGVARYAALRLPTLLGQLLPMATLVAAALTFMRLAADLELTALRAVGVSTWRMLAALLPACGLAAVVQFALLDQVAPPTQRALVDWWAAHPAPGAPAEPEQRLWLRARGDVVAVDRVSLDGRRLEGVVLIRRDPERLATARIDAVSATHAGGTWTLHEVRIAHADSPVVEAVDAMPWPEGPSPRNMVELARPTETQPVARTLQVLRGEWASSRGTAHHATRLQAGFAGLLGPAIMLLLAAPAAFALPRRGNGGLYAALGLVLGLGYLTAGGLTAALGEAGLVSPVLAAWAPPLAFGCIGLMILLRLEEG